MAVLSSSPAPGRVRPAAALASASGRAPTTGLALLSAGAVCATALLDPAAVADGPVVCPFRLLTGLPCPGCGMTRAWVFLAHGSVGDALMANPFALVTLPAAVVLVLLVFLSAVRRGQPPDLARVARSPATKIVVVAWVVFAVARVVAVLMGHASP